MRHRKSGRKFNRTSAHRKAMFSNMTASLVEHELIKNNFAKGKRIASRSGAFDYIGKNDSVANRRLAFARLGNNAAVAKLFNELGPRYNARPGGYLRILKCGFRAGDMAPMAYVELVDRPVDAEAVDTE